MVDLRIWAIFGGGKKAKASGFLKDPGLRQLLRGTESLSKGLRCFSKLDVVVVYVSERKAWQKELVHKQLLQNCSAQKKSLAIQFSLWIRLKMQVENWAPNSSYHGLQSTWGQPNLNCLGTESVSTNYLSFLISLSFFSCFLFTPFVLINKSAKCKLKGEEGVLHSAFLLIRLWLMVLDGEKVSETIGPSDIIIKTVLMFSSI